MEKPTRKRLRKALDWLARALLAISAAKWVIATLVGVGVSAGAWLEGQPVTAIILTGILSAAGLLLIIAVFQSAFTNRGNQQDRVAIPATESPESTQLTAPRDDWAKRLEQQRQHYEEVRIPALERLRDSAIDKKDQEIVALKGELRHHNWLLSYGIEPLGLLTIKDADRAEARKEIARFSDILENLETSIKQLIGEMLTQYETKHRTGKWAECVSLALLEVFPDPTLRLLKLLRKPGQEDPRNVFIAFYERYRRLRWWMGRLANELDRPLQDFSGYGDWYRVEGKFFEKTNDFPDLLEFAELRQLIKQQKLDGFPWELPPPGQPGLHRAFSQLSEPQRSFLLLFSADTPDTAMIEYNVYMAGMELVQKGVLIAKGDLFTVTPEVAGMLKSLFQFSAVRTEVRVGPERIISHADGR